MPERQDLTREVEVLRWREGTIQREGETVAVDAMVTYHVEPLGLLDIVMVPSELEEFIAGHLYSGGLIKGAEAMGEVFVGQRGDRRLEVLVELDPGGLDLRKEVTVDALSPGKGLLLPEEGSPPAWHARPLEPIAGRLGMTAGALLGLPKELAGRTELFTSTGAFHYAFIVDREGSVLHSAYDIGRHAAIDKVIGKVLLEGGALEQTALYTTGRISSNTARKCVRSRIPLVISRGAPFMGAVELARKQNLGVVGFLRGGRFNVYAGEDHILWD